MSHRRLRRCARPAMPGHAIPHSAFAARRASYCGRRRGCTRSLRCRTGTDNPRNRSRLDSRSHCGVSSARRIAIAHPAAAAARRRTRSTVSAVAHRDRPRPPRARTADRDPGHREWRQCCRRRGDHVLRAAAGADPRCAPEHESTPIRTRTESPRSTRCGTCPQQRSPQPATPHRATAAGPAASGGNNDR